MAITIAISKELKVGEDRVAIVPLVAEKLTKLGGKIKIQRDLGSGIYLADSAYKDVTIADTLKDLYANSELIIKIHAPTDEEISYMPEGVILICMLYPHTRPEILKKLCAKKITCLAMEMIPRISRAQTMDVLSTQATIFGYKAVLIAANKTKFFFPMLATGAGTMRPANVLVIGIGVAGLQAIATAKRLGARVEAYDVRPETKQEAESLGAKFVDTGVQAVGVGGYARELTTEEKQQQQAVLEKHIVQSDVIIATAGVPGRPAPKIISKTMVEKMKAGSVIVDTMAEMGGNCELTKIGEQNYKDVTIVGTENLASSLAINGSEMYAKNVLHFLTPMFTEEGFKLDWQDEVIIGCAVTRDGDIIHSASKKLVEDK